MPNSSVGPLWTSDPTTDSTRFFNGSITYLNDSYFDGYNSFYIWDQDQFAIGFNPEAWTDGYPTYTLILGTCYYNGNQNFTQECGAMCSDPRIFFQDQTTFYNCFLAPSVVAALQHPDPDVRDSNALAAAQLGLYPNSTVPDPVNTTIDCFTDFCAAIGGCDACNGSMLEGLRGNNRSAVLDACFVDICNMNDQGTLDGDLGGIGVYISYVLQLGISFLGPALQFVMWRYSRGSPARQSRYPQLHRPALISAYNEFHRAQCLFTAAIQIAALVILRNNPINYSKQMLHLNYGFLQVVAISGLISVTYTYLFLSYTTQRSTYRFILTMTAFVLATAGFASFTTYYQDFVEAHPDGNTNLPACGNVDISQLCTSNRWSFGVEGGSIGIMWWFYTHCSLSMLHITLDFISPLYLSKTVVALYRLYRCKGKPELGWRAYYREQQGAPSEHGITATCLVFLLPYVPIFAVQFGILITFFQYVSNDTWSFGQIIAITVWTSVLLEFIQLEILGMKNGFIHRLPTGFSVAYEPEISDALFSAEHETQERNRVQNDTLERDSDDTSTATIEQQSISPTRDMDNRRSLHN